MAQKSNIVVITAVFPPEPVVSAKLSFDIANLLSKNNVVTVISPQPSRPFGFQFSSVTMSFNFQHIQLNSFTCASSRIIGRLRESYSFGRHCSQYIANNHININIIYVNTWPLLGQYLVVKTALKFKIPIIIHIQDIYPESLIHKYPKIKHLLKFSLFPVDKYILQNATRIIAISDQMRNYLASSRNISNEKIVVVQNWQDESVFVKFKSTNNQLAEQNRPFTFMYLGNIGPVAGIELIIDAFASANLQNCRLVIAGAGSMQKELYKKAVELNLNSIEFWSVPDGKVPEIQNKADVMLLPIKNGAASSSIPSKLPAYMFSEKPIIACVEKNSDTANALNDANCGWVLPPDNLNNLVENLKMVSQLSKEVLKIKGKNGFEYAMEHFNKRINLGKLINVINEIIPAI